LSDAFSTVFLSTLGYSCAQEIARVVLFAKTCKDLSFSILVREWLLRRATSPTLTTKTTLVTSVTTSHAIRLPEAISLLSVQCIRSDVTLASPRQAPQDVNGIARNCERNRSAANITFS